MRSFVFGLLACCSFLSACLSAAEIHGKIVDPSGAPVPGAQISVVGRTGVAAQTRARFDGTFDLNAAELTDSKIVITAPGFRTLSLPFEPSVNVQLEIAPQVDSVQVTGSAIDVSASEQGGSVSIIPNEEIRRSNQPFALDLLRYVPGLTFNQSGPIGGVTSLFLRGGNSNFNLVRIDGVPVNWFGGYFDFAHVPSEALERVEVARGPQSAVYGSYANSGAIDFVTRQPGQPQLDLLAEGGTYHERRFGITGSGVVGGLGIVASLSRYDNDGPVANSDYRNEDAMLRLSRRFGRQSVSFGGYFDANESGEPGAYGSDPMHTFQGIDTVSREKNNFGELFAHYEADVTSRVRAEAFGSFYRDNVWYRSQYGDSYDNHVRGQGEARAIVSVSPHYTAAIGVSGGRERVENTFITGDTFDVFPLSRNDVSVYLENRVTLGNRLFLNAGVRGEFIGQPQIFSDNPARPRTSTDAIARVNPKIAAAWVERGTRLHASFGTGIRPPNGFELAFTDNPSLKPERTRSVDAGVEQKLLGGALLVDATYFYNRFYDLIVSLGGSLSRLSRYKTDNIANSRAEGAEFSAKLRPARWVFVTGSYTLLETRILSLDGSSGQAPVPFQVGQPLTRRPEHSGNFVATFTGGRVAVDLTGYFRGKALYEEPYLGATNGLFWNPGFANVGINLNYRLARGLTAYGNLRNALNRHYEEVFGYPSPRLNFVAGLKWRIERGQ